MSEDIVYLDDLAKILTKKTDEGKIKWESGEPRGYTTRIEENTIGIFFHPRPRSPRPSVFEIPDNALTGSNAYWMSVVDVGGNPIKSCKIDQDQIGFQIYADLWNAASKSTRRGDSSLKALIDRLEELA